MAKKILIIDDEELITKSLLKLLSASGYSVVVVRSGADALAKVKEEDFDLIVSDVRMPGKDGIDTITEIRSYLSEKGKEQVPEILITGYADAQKYEQAMKLGVTEYLYKPFDREDFLCIVKKAIK